MGEINGYGNVTNNQPYSDVLKTLLKSKRTTAVGLIICKHVRKCRKMLYYLENVTIKVLSKSGSVATFSNVTKKTSLQNICVYRDNFGFLTQISFTGSWCLSVLRTAMIGQLPMAFLRLRWVEFFQVCNGCDGGGFSGCCGGGDQQWFFFFWLKVFILF